MYRLVTPAPTQDAFIALDAKAEVKKNMYDISCLEVKPSVMWDNEHQIINVLKYETCALDGEMECFEMILLLDILKREKVISEDLDIKYMLDVMYGKDMIYNIDTVVKQYGMRYKDDLIGSIEDEWDPERDLDKQIKDAQARDLQEEDAEAREELTEDYESYYIDKKDVTVIFKRMYNKDNELVREEISGFYYGETLEADTEYYKEAGVKVTFD